MPSIRIFISSVQREFHREREALRDHLRSDPLMRRFFEVFLFEDVPATDRRPDELYLDEVERCDVYLGLLGHDYGSEDCNGVSPTEREFNCATENGVHRLIFVKGAGTGSRHPKVQALIEKAQAGLIRKRFDTPEELVASVNEALVQYLEGRELIRLGPFDAATCMAATVDDLAVDRMRRFILMARTARQFPLSEGVDPQELLMHLDLLKDGRPTNAAMLLFGKSPQRFLISSEIRCAHFHGTEVAKPIPSLQSYKGTVFDLVDQAVNFVLSNIAMSVGTREESIQVPVAYEIPKQVVTEAIVNAVAHRDYTSGGSVQVMLFSDRLEVWNPGKLPRELTIEDLRVPHKSLPRNRLLAEPLYLAGYIERMGTGTVDMIRRCADAGLPEPEFSSRREFRTRILRVSAVRVSCDGKPAANAEVQVLLPSGEWKRSTTDSKGEARFKVLARNLPMTVFAAAEGCSAYIEPDWMPDEGTLAVELKRLAGGGSVICPEASGEVPGLRGRLSPIQDAQGRTYLYAANIAINHGLPQPVDFRIGEDLHLMDSDGTAVLARVVALVERSALVEFRSTRDRPEWRPEEPPHLLAAQVLRLLSREPMSQAGLSKNLPEPHEAARLDKAVRLLLADTLIARMLPDKPHSGLPRYRLTARGRAVIAEKSMEGPET